MMRCLFVFLLLWTSVLGEEREESRREEYVRRMMGAMGVKTEGMSFVQEGRSNLVRILRGEKLVGYYREEVVWAPAKVVVPEGVTRITFGFKKGDGETFFTVEDKGVVALWLSAYERYTEKARVYGHFVPLTKDAAFAEKREESFSAGGCMCSLGLRFYRGEEEVLYADGHLQDVAVMDGMWTRNEALHALVVASMPKPKEEPLPDGPADPNVYDPDPFAEPFVETVDEVKAWVQEWVKAFNEDDAKRMMAFYEDGEKAKELDMLVSVGRWHHGREEAQKAYEGDAEVLDYYDSKAVDLKARYLGGNYALVSFQHDFKYRVKEDGRRFRVRIRTTMTLRWLGGGWKIVQEHSSPMEGVPRVVEIGGRF